MQHPSVTEDDGMRGRRNGIIQSDKAITIPDMNIENRYM